ncbi:CNNM domain-containing protein [Comamonas sp. Tr-654]|uniref:CNNM domain-containing protein n=1 Tax=Comamonas sp. Tr-654 TaxID=2608341 RepID=UPI00351B9235
MPIVVTAITFITIIFCELVPVRIGQLHPKPVSVLAARPMASIASVAKPFVRLLAFSTHVILTPLSINESTSTTVSEEEVVASLEQGVMRVRLRRMSTRWCEFFTFRRQTSHIFNAQPRRYALNGWRSDDVAGLDACAEGWAMGGGLWYPVEPWFTRWGAGHHQRVQDVGAGREIKRLAVRACTGFYILA